MAGKFAFQVWGTDSHGNFLMSYASEFTEKNAYLESGKWKNATHFKLISADGSTWREWGMSRARRDEIIFEEGYAHKSILR